MKNTFVKKFTVCALAGVLGFALSACDDSSSASGDNGSGGNRGGIPDTVETFMELSDYDCGKSQKCVATYLTEYHDMAVCDGDSGWVIGTLIEKMDCDFSSSSDKSSDSKNGYSSSSSGTTPNSWPEGVKPSGYYAKNCPANQICKDATSSLEYLNQEMLAAGKYGEMLDPRDGQVYKTIEICNRLHEKCHTWMAQNLNYDPGDVSSMGNYAWSGCYNDEADSCAKYGRLYTWEVAMNNVECGDGNTCNPTGVQQGVCPAGWHLPDLNSLDTLMSSQEVAGISLKSQTGWKSATEGEATNRRGFSALPAGQWQPGSKFGGFKDAGYYTYFWSTIEHGSEFAYAVHLRYDSFKGYEYTEYKKFAHSVRCLKDSE
ncbi:MAG: fibrobacter succinogenes major paralogous domain-containing protein [Fibrobacter sp.]|nr:fibrobacter succinogenes major paralogous domain-containing protein [Fibrobacter sp.]